MNTKYHQTEGFKFPAAGLIGLDAGTKASVSKFLRAREREINTIETVFMICDGGPFNGQSIELQPNGGMGEAHLVGLCLKHLERVRVHITAHGQVAGGGCQVLADGQHLDVVGAHVPHGF